MKKCKKNISGITLISLVITIIILLILASITVYSGKNLIKSSKFEVFSTELKLMQMEVNELYQNKNFTLGKELSISTEVSSQANKVFSALGITDQTGYKYFDQATIKDDLKVDNISGEFIVNVENRKVISFYGMEYDGETYYTLEQLPNSLYNVEYEENTNKPTFDASVETVNEGKWKITISNIQYDGYINKWQVKYQLEGESYWSTSDDLNFFVTENGVYNVYLSNQNVVSDTKKIAIGVAEPTPEENTSLTELSQMLYGVIEIEFLNGTSYATTTTPNTPILKDGMTAVHWNGTTEVNDETDWYQYVAQTSTTETGGTSRWANAKTSDGSFYVWIPRYAYRIIYFDSETHENEYRAGTLTEEEALANDYIVGYSDARGIVDKDGKRPTEVSSQTGISVNSKYFRTHPAFDGNVDEGGWDSKLTGIWVMKYEASKNDASESAQGSGTTPKSLPGVQSWRNTTIGDMFTYAKSAYGENNTILNSHMIKNSEWGAVAYLTDSKYGRNGTEIAINNSNSCITGNSGKTTYASSGAATYNYNTEEGFLASSTGNIYGIYDLSGGSWEYVIAYYKNENVLNGSIFAPEISDKYSTSYSGVSVLNNYLLGDATYETQKWNGDNFVFIDASKPVFARSGFHGNNSGAGIFNLGSNTGISDPNAGFRVCLAVK